MAGEVMAAILAYVSITITRRAATALLHHPGEGRDHQRAAAGPAAA
jgi:hypothetical protein